MRSRQSVPGQSKMASKPWNRMAYRTLTTLCMVQDCKRSPSSNAIKLSGKVLSIIYKITVVWITTLESLVLTCKETQWTHLVLEVHYTHACVGRPIKPLFAPLELCYCLYHFFSLQINHFSPFDTKPVQIWLICRNWEVCSLPSALQLTYNLSGSYPWLVCSSDHKHKGKEFDSILSSRLWGGALCLVWRYKERLWSRLVIWVWDWF